MRQYVRKGPWMHRLAGGRLILWLIAAYIMFAALRVASPLFGRIIVDFRVTF